jgi:predicted DsbA family dithiol-disulfide isomerase
MEPVKIIYVSDVLCIWAYAAKARLDEIMASFGDSVSIESRFCSVFPDTRSKIETVWGTRGRYDGFNQHLLEVGERFAHIKVSPQIWTEVKPHTSASAHLFLKAVQIVEAETGVHKNPAIDRDSVFNRMTWEMRHAFFHEALDISNFQVLLKIADRFDLRTERIKDKLETGEAIAQLANDYHFCAQNRIEGSPTYLLNEGRQRLFGNVGYRIIEANVRELLRHPDEGKQSWC